MTYPDVVQIFLKPGEFVQLVLANILLHVHDLVRIAGRDQVLLYVSVWFDFVVLILGVR